MERTEEFKESEEFKELAFTIRSRFAAFDSATPENVRPDGFYAAFPLSKVASLNSSNSLNSLNSFLCVLNCGRFHS
jgi:hypothetical protein